MSASGPDPTDTSLYIGQELELFEQAVTWKSYLASRLRPHIRGDVLDVGAGLGANVPYCDGPAVSRYVALEPDGRLLSQFQARQAAGRIPASCAIVQGTLTDLSPSDTFDTILYIDVLEHIEDDRAEWARAFTRLRPGGRLIIVCPAHQSLMSAFDRAIGHHRRYDKTMFRALGSVRPHCLEYLDSVGMIASLANRVALRQAYPSARQIAVWDRLMVPASRWLDPCLGRSLGKTILGVWSPD